MTTRFASCCCGNLKATCDGQPERRSVCHCFSCQKRTGSAFSLNSLWRDDQVRIEGESKVYETVGEEGHWARKHFCPTCGSTVFWRIERAPGMVYVAVGCFSEPGFPEPTVAVYSERRHPWLRIETAAPIAEN